MNNNVESLTGEHLQYLISDFIAKKYPDEELKVSKIFNIYQGSKELNTKKAVIYNEDDVDNQFLAYIDSDGGNIRDNRVLPKINREFYDLILSLSEKIWNKPLIQTKVTIKDTIPINNWDKNTSFSKFSKKENELTFIRILIDSSNLDNDSQKIKAFLDELEKEGIRGFVSIFFDYQSLDDINGDSKGIYFDLRNGYPDLEQIINDLQDFER